MEYEVQPFFKTLAVLASLFSTEIRAMRVFLLFFWLIFFQPQGPQDAKQRKRDFTQSEQNETHAKPRAYSRQLPRPDTYKTKLLAT